MAEEQNDEESEYDDEEEEIDEPYDDYVLRGFRFLMGEEDEEDIAQEQYEQQMEEAAEERANDHELNQEPMPSAAYVTEKLTERGVRMEDLVKLILEQHDAYNMPESELEALERLDGEIYGKVRIILGAYNPNE